MKLDLIIFDCDGVLIASEILANRSEVEALRSFGIKFELNDYMNRFVGKNTKDVLDGIESLHGVRLSEDSWRLVQENTSRIFESELKPITGGSELLASIDKAKCVASSSSLERLDLTLKLTGLLDIFSPDIFSSEQVARGKPAPDLFLFAAEQMQVHPDRCIVIEDSVTGVRSSVAAGMKVIGFTGGSHIQMGHQEKLIDAGAVEIFSEMSQISDWLRTQ